MSYILGEFITKEGLENVKNYKYIPGTYSRVDQIMDPYWKWWVNLLPMTLAPNIITLLGFVVVFIPSVLMIWCDPSLTVSPPIWACLLFGVGMFVYQTLDAVDGKQARRTGSSSPLGKLFDHGLDGVIESLCSLSLVSVFWYGLSFKGVLCLMGTWTPQFSLFILEYYTGVFEYSVGNVDETLNLLILIIFNLSPAIFGVTFYDWKILDFSLLPYSIQSFVLKVLSFFNFSDIFTRGFVMRDLGLIFIVYHGLIFSMIAIYKMVKSQKSFKMIMFVLFQLSQQLLSYFVLFNFDTNIDFIKKNVVFCYIMIILIYNIVQTKLIICQVSKMVFYPLQFEYLAFLIYFYYQHQYDGSEESERNLKFGFFATLAVLGCLYIRLLHTCVSQIKEYLSLDLFSIAKKPKTS